MNRPIIPSEVSRRQFLGNASRLFTGVAVAPHLIASPGLAADSGPSASPEPLSPAATSSRTGRQQTGLCLNEDCDHFLVSRVDKKLDAAAVDSWVDQYAQTQVRELVLNANAMRTAYDSKVWEPFWRGYDPAGPDDQPLLASLSPNERASTRKIIHLAWELNQAGLDRFERWIARARQCALSPWISMRMNDVHSVNDERAPGHSEFWRTHPALRRVTYRFTDWKDRALDYGQAEVREHSLQLIRELAERYDFDGLELDWMRFGFHFRPGHEVEGGELLAPWIGQVRKLLLDWEQKRGHRIRLGARVPPRPEVAANLGLDGVRWAREGWVDMLVATPFFVSIDTDIPVERWRQLLPDTPVTLAAGLEYLLRPYPTHRHQVNSLETVRGAAASLWDRGADRIYLFNYMDLDPATQEFYPTLLRECGSLETLAGKPRRHVVTFCDTWPVGEPVGYALPAPTAARRWLAFRLHTGPRPESGKAAVLLGMEGVSEAEMRNWEVRVNAERCSFLGVMNPKNPRPDYPLYGFEIALAVLNRGYNVIEVAAQKDGLIRWVEIEIRP